MASLVNKLGFCLFLLFLEGFFLSQPVHCNEDEDNLLQGLNSYRTAQNLPAFTKNDKAECLADEIADQLEDEPCTNHTTATMSTVPGSVPPRITNYQDLLSKCKIDPNNTRAGLILPVCAPNRVPSLVLTNYTHTGYSKYLNDSRYSGAGVGSEDEWIVVILTTNTQAGSFASAALAVGARVVVVVAGLAFSSMVL